MCTRWRGLSVWVAYVKTAVWLGIVSAAKFGLFFFLLAFRQGFNDWGHWIFKPLRGHPQAELVGLCLPLLCPWPGGGVREADLSGGGWYVVAGAGDRHGDRALHTQCECHSALSLVAAMPVHPRLTHRRTTSLSLGAVVVVLQVMQFWIVDNVIMSKPATTPAAPLSPTKDVRDPPTHPPASHSPPSSLIHPLSPPLPPPLLSPPPPPCLPACLSSPRASRSATGRCWTGVAAAAAAAASC